MLPRVRDELHGPETISLLRRFPDLLMFRWLFALRLCVAEQASFFFIVFAIHVLLQRAVRKTNEKDGSCESPFSLVVDNVAHEPRRRNRRVLSRPQDPLALPSA